MEVVINTCFGGFGLSDEAHERLGHVHLKDETGFEYWSPSAYDIPRNDPALVAVVKELGDKASGSCAKLKVIEIPDDVKWDIEDYDGMERVVEKHRSWS